MKSRLALISTLFAGSLFGMSGIANAQTTGDDAAAAQYANTPPVTQTVPTPPPAVAPTQAAGEGDVAADESSSAPVKAAPVAAPAPAQVAATNEGELPFTGFAAIPVLLLGLGLLGGGLLLRRRASGN